MILEHRITITDLVQPTDKRLEKLFPIIEDRVKFKENLKKFCDEDSEYDEVKSRVSYVFHDLPNV